MAGLRDYSKYATLGISWVVTTGVYLYLGYRGGQWLDARWETGPIFFVIGILLGMTLSVVALVKELLALTDAGVIRSKDGAGNKNDRVREKNNFPNGEGPGREGRGSKKPGKPGRNGPAR